MNRENILFSVVGLLLGYVIAFHLVVYVNQNQPAQGAAGAAGAGAADSLPADHPSVAGEGGQDAQRLTAAAEQAGQAAREKPDDFAAQTKAAEAYFRAGRFEDAIDFESRANKLRPDDYDTIVRLGNFYSSAGRFDDAARWYTAALAKRPNDCDARSELALTYYMRTPRQADRAISELRRALEIDPGHVPSLHNLTLMLVEAKQFAESETMLARLERADPTYEDLPRLREEVEKARKGGANSSAAGAPDASKKAPTD